MIYGKMRERLFKGISSYFKGAKSTFTQSELTIRLPKGEAEAVLQELFSVPIEKDEVIEPNQIVAWRGKEALNGKIDCLIMYDYDDDTQQVVYVRIYSGDRMDTTYIGGGDFNGKHKITPEEMKGWVSGYPYKADIIYSESRTLNFSRRGFL